VPKSSPATDASTLAIVNNQTITSADIETAVAAAVLNDPDLYLRDFFQDREKAIKEARQRALDARINSMLIATEARKRSLATEDFVNSEVSSKVAPPTEAEIRAVYDANRAQLGNADLESVRANIVNYLRGQRTEQLYGDLLNRLKMTNTVMKHADVN